MEMITTNPAPRRGSALFDQCQPQRASLEGTEKRGLCGPGRW